MEKQELKKNRLDMEYKFEAQKANIYLTLGTITSLGFVGIMVAQKMLVFGMTLSSSVIFYAYLMYRQSKSRMDYILSQIEGL